MDLNFTNLIGYCCLFFGLGYVTNLSIIYLSRSSKFLKLKSFLVIPSAKSSSNAVLLGGLSLSLVVAITFIGTDIDNRTVNNWINYNIIPLLALISYGYIDDRFEILPKYKLLAQSFVSLSSSVIFFESMQMPPDLLNFLTLFCLNLIMMNGTNLIDGIDTLSLKYGLSTFGQYMFMSYLLSQSFSFSMSLWWFTGLVPFYFFNKSPAKMYLGEVGSSLLGYCGMSLFSMLIVQGATWHMAIIPLSYPCAEVVVSFFRRILNSKAPFIGDRLHLHHLTLKKFNGNTSLTSSVIALADFTSNLICILIAFKGYKFTGALLALGSQVLRQVIVGWSEWKLSTSEGGKILQFAFNAKNMRKNSAKYKEDESKVA